jgi:hypothetical protein
MPSGSGVVELRSNDADYCALLGSGGVSCWFNNDWSTGMSMTTPVSVSGF